MRHKTDHNQKLMYSHFLQFLVIIILCCNLVSATGSVHSAGDSILKTNELRELTGANGSGVIIGVISNGAKGLTESQESGDLPDNVIVLKDGRGSEGTAMMEIVHDIAPNATLIYHDFGGGNDENFIAAFRNLIDAGASIIVEDVGNYEVPYFEDGNIASAIYDIAKNHPDVFIISAAGNYADVHYQGSYTDGGDGYHSFNGSTGIPVEIKPGGRLKVVLQWDDPFDTATHDFDLFLYDVQENAYISISNQLQTGEEKPLEKLNYQNVGDKPQKAEIRIQAKEGSRNDPVILELLFMVDKEKISIDETFLNPGDSIFGWSALPNIITVSTISAENMQIQKFSSQGTVTITNPSHDIRKKPDITGVDNVDVTGSGNFMKKFTGTSAAAPHVGGLLALIQSLYPSLTPEKIRDALFDSTFDLGEPGWDPIYGYGLADALSLNAYIQKEGLKPEITTVNESTVIPDINISTTGPMNAGSITESCIIQNPGKYTLGEDIVDYSPSIITISSSDVFLDGAGHSLSGITIQFGIESPVLQNGILIWSPDNKTLSNITISNLNITGTYAGISAKNAENVVIKDSALQYNAIGVELFNSHNMVVQDCYISGNGYSGIHTDRQSAESVIKENRIQNNLYGIIIDGSSVSQITRNIVSGNYYDGIKLDHGVTQTLIDNNQCTGNHNGGISLYSGHKNTITNNTCELNNPAGILLHESSENIISGNQMKRNIRGINCYYSDGNAIMSNIIMGNDATGIMLQPSGNNKITQNLIFGNSAEGILITQAVGSDQQNLIADNYLENIQNIRIQEGGKPNYVWYEKESGGMNIVGGPNLGGNVWSNPEMTGFSQTCQDQNSDGFCDLPYNINAENSDKLPIKFTGPTLLSEELKGTVLKSEPVSAEEWVTKGKTLMGSGDYTGAINAFDKAISLSPTNYQAWRDKALSFKELKNYDEAFSTLNTILQIYPDKPELWSTAGDIYLVDLKNYSESIPFYEKSITLDEQDIHSLVNLAFAYDKTGNSEIALELYRKALVINPSLTDAWNKAGNILTRAEQFDEAIRMYDKALEIDPRNAFVLNNKGYALYLAGKYSEAIETLQKALDIDPEYSSAWKNLGAALSKTGHITESEAAYAKSEN